MGWWYWSRIILCLMLCKFWPRSALFLCFRHSDFSLKRRSENCLINRARYATITHPRGSGWSCFGCLNRRDVAIQSRKTRWKSCAISKNFVGYCVGCEELCGAWQKWFLRKRKGWKPVDNQVKAYLKARSQERSRRLLREPLPTAKKRKAPPWKRWRSQGVYVWVFSLF